MEAPADEHQMSDFEALMWNLEKDPRLSSNMGNLNIFDRCPDVDRLRATLERATVVFPRLRQRVAPVFGRLAPPRWELDPDFDIDHHFKVISLGGRGTRRDLDDYVARSIMTPFDRRRPLWEFVLIEGLRGGKAAMVQRLHHTITDGQGGLRLSLEFLDFERDAPQREPVEAPVVHHHDPSLVDSVTDAVGHVARRQLGIVRRAASEAASGLRHSATHPASIADQASRTVEFIGSTMRQVNVGDHPLSPLWVDRSLSRAFRRLDVRLERMRSAANRFEVSINDMFVAGALLGAADYHRSAGTPAERLRMAMPVSHRTDKSVGGNLFAPTQSTLPATVTTPAEAIAAVHEVLQRTKSESATAAMASFAGAINLLPTSVVTSMGFRIASTVDFVTSNLRAAPFDTFMAGALVESSYPVGPLAGSAFNLTTMSFRGVLDMGLFVDTAAVADVDLLAASLADAYKRIATAKPVLR
ncbi:MAG: WS/DGAT domain-containing protein [Microthrixaceae bacterium]|nr:DUF1298 domain-containing protein [Microthrixaceae bacterium]MCO5311893.1 WS/DGAT domain-containing protein [Microthrixaceae bacterium]